MLNQGLKGVIVDHVLPDAQTPAQYVGGEWNAVVKDHRSLGGKLCLAFPDTYSIGMSHHGLQVLYDLMNRRDDWACERAFMPLGDVEKMLRERKLPLWGLETFTPLCEFDVVGFTLQYDLCYSNVLTMLDLGGIPIVAEERHDVASAGDCRWSVRGQSRADVAVHRFVRHRRRRRDVADGVRSLGEAEELCNNGFPAGKLSS